MGTSKAPARAPMVSLLHEGITPPDDIPPDIFAAALATFLAGRRLDMQALAAELGLSRSTLYRKVRDREQVLGGVIWYLARRALQPALVEAEKRVGTERILFVLETFMTFVHSQPALRQFLDAEPEAALRILTSKHGRVQGALVDLTDRALAAEEQAGVIELTLDRHTLAFVITRIGETFMYADVIADNEPDIALAVDVIGRLLRETARPS